MRIVFWQNQLSPHQLPYIKQIIKDKRINEVVFVAGDEICANRKQMGWEISDLNDSSNLKVIVAPNKNIINELFMKDQDNSWHLFSGLRGFEFVFETIRISLNFKVHRGIISERPNTFAFGMCNGKPLWLHKLRFFIQDRKYAKYFDKVFAMGDDAVKYFSTVYKKWEVIPFAYCTDSRVNNERKNSIGDAKFCFVGSLSSRKSPQNIIKAALRLKKTLNISFIGGGKKEYEIRNLLKNSTIINVTFYGFQSNSKVMELMNNHDVLILPSIHDGWGAVVNEALQAGLYVVCSDKCGAKELLTNDRLGKVFNSFNIDELTDIMNYITNNIDTIRNDRLYRIEWSKKCISGNTIAKYMVDNLLGIKEERPWFKNEF